MRYHQSRGDDQRNVCLIPSSAHGTNPASAALAGMKVVIVECDDHGNVDMDDLKLKAERHTEDLAAIMVTYPSTHGVFESSIRYITKHRFNCESLLIQPLMKLWRVARVHVLRQLSRTYVGAEKN